ncbi:hypothetical protein AMTR_s00044p00183280 [Amborella trichopoda]|uniref:Aminotransferase-like plant mobile domain-containing protein n=1 Tax=Amborella trichopoda TaxID=13333 RepID=U5D4T1_AMBTC|nr:hypothetical protein AMTR_s00044p00183280 [Amborella trichopoda]
MEKQEIRIDEKTFQLNDWHLTDDQVQLVNAFGLGALSIIQSGRINHPLVAANVERWRSKTNSFHYNIQIGEMIPTLFDVYEILRLTVDVAPVLTRYLQFFEDIEEAGGYAWGAATLVFLYQSLGKACTFKRRHFSGSATLIQCWSYEYIMHMRLIPHSISPNMPRAKRWEPLKNYYGNPHNMMPPIRQELDSLQPNEVSADQASTTMLAEALTLRQKWFLEVYNHVNNAFEMLSKFVPVDIVDIEARMEILRQVNNEVV